MDRDSLAFWVLLGAAVIALVVLVTLTLTPRRDAGEPLEARASPFDFGSMPPLAPLPSPPISMEPLELPPPSPLDPSTSVAPADLVAAPRPTTTAPPRPDPTRTPSKPAARKPAAPIWSASLNQPVALEVGGQAGMLLRHQNFVAQVSPVGSASRALDRADATFVLRPGLANKGCLSFEASNFKGFYLRHKNFVLQLTRNDGTSLFRSDATFCPEPASGGSLTLRAVNYPGHRLALQWNRVALSPVSAAQAMHVRLRPPP
ncbi:AbfB domain-containing protein [Actinoplanes sp. NPDC049265]|uniref:AbfB domain-containing protein n=1 Tax=Actinoplanes sp. NPDC049265 TaxID=3363902 RepID=UPI0037188785